MSVENKNSYNHAVFKKSYRRLNLSPTNRIIFQRLLGFLLRNDRPFPYSAVTMAEITGFSLRTIFNSLNDLEKYRLIKRVGQGKNRRFKRGSILVKVITTVQNRTKKVQNKNEATVQPVHQKSTNRATGAYSKTSFFSKRSVCGAKPRPDSKAHTQESSLSFSPVAQTVPPDSNSLRSRCLSDKAVQARFKSKFDGYNLTIEQLLDECMEHYNRKVTVNKFLRWIGWEKIENHTKTMHKDTKGSGKALRDYQEYVSLAKSDPGRKTPILNFSEFMLSSQDKNE